MHVPTIWSGLKFVYRLKDVVTYVSLFTIGHSVTRPTFQVVGTHSAFPSWSPG